MRTNSGCACRVPLDDAAVPTFASTSEVYDWLHAHGVDDVGPDHMGRTSIPVADAQRLWDESEVASALYESAAAERRAAHVAAVAELRTAVAEAFLAEVGGEASVSPEGILTVEERKAGRVVAGLEAARAAWAAAPFDVRQEVISVPVREGDTEMNYDLSVVLPRATVEDGINRAVARANKAAR